MIQPLDMSGPSEQNSSVDSAGRIAAGLAVRGFPIFADMDFSINGSHAHSNAFLKFALSDDLACAEFMRIKSIKDICSLPLAIHANPPVQTDAAGALSPEVSPLAVLLCAQKVQMLLYIAAEEVRQTLKQGVFSRRVKEKSLKAGYLSTESHGGFITAQDHYVSSLPLELPLDLPAFIADGAYAQPAEQTHAAPQSINK